MKVSFISTVYNEEKNIRKFIDSILNQERKPEEIIIIDGGSTDKTYSILQEYSRKNKRIKIFLKKGYNIAKARNFAIKEAKGEVIFVSDAGCIISKEWIKDTLKYFPKADVVAGSYKAIIKNKFEYFQSLINVVKVDRPSRMSSRNIAFKKSCWKKVRGYPEKNLAGEDTLFNIYLQKKQCKIKINSTKHVSWEMRPDLKSFIKQFIRYGQGDRVQGNLLRLKKNLIMVVGFWIYLFLFVYSVFFFKTLSLILFFIPMIYLFFEGLRYLIKTKRASAMIYIPMFIIGKRLGYIYGATLYQGTIRYGKR